MYTKGNWYIEKDDFETRILAITEGDDWPVEVAEILQPDRDDFIKTIEAEQKANAHLIVASPNCYEALKALVDHFRMNDENYFKSDLCTDALNALSKAEGL